MTKYKQTNSFYNTKIWRRKRIVILKRDEYKCRECNRYGYTTQATTVHHIFPLEDYPQYKLNNNNLISLCNDCHEAMHNRFENCLTVKGERWVERVKKKLSPPLINL